MAAAQTPKPSPANRVQGPGAVEDGSISASPASPAGASNSCVGMGLARADSPRAEEGRV